MGRTPLALIVAERGTDWGDYDDLVGPGTQIIQQCEDESAGAFLKRLRLRLSQWSVLPKSVAWLLSRNERHESMESRIAALRRLVSVLAADGGGDLRVNGAPDSQTDIAARALVQVISEQTRDMAIDVRYQPWSK